MQHIIDKLEAEYPHGVELGYVDYSDNLDENPLYHTSLYSGKN